MCGFTGFCDFSSHNGDEQILTKMTDQIAHRGPDSAGVEVYRTGKGAIGFGHRRLSILDLSEAGRQPMSRRHLKIIFNGEVYNFMEIRGELEAKGHSFRSHSDTEVILAAYEEWGMNCLQKFIGMYAFAIYDSQKEKVFLARDRVGAKPLYLYHRGDTMLFGSELKSFHHYPRFEKEINYEALALFLQYSYIPAPYCIFRHTRKVKPGHYVEIDLDSKAVTESCYWDVNDAYNQPKLDISYEEAVDHTENILKSAFNYRMVADVPVGVFLSGGYDSSAVAALLQKDRTEKIKTFTIGYKESEYNEAEEAKAISQYLGTDHTEWYIGPKEAEEVLTELPFIYDEPFADNSTVPTVLVSKLARQQVKVALSGDGGDEIFGGYNKFKQSVGYTSIPAPVQMALAAGMGMFNPDKLPYLSGKYNFASRYEKMYNIWKSRSPYVALKNIAHYITTREAHTLLKPRFEEVHTFFDDEKLLNDHNDVLNKLLAIDYKTFLPDNNLVKIDRAAMSVGLEGREPFLDQRVIELVSRFPSGYKIRNGVTKSLLKDVVHRYIRPELMERPKKPFIAPLGLWFKKELTGQLTDYLNYDVLQGQGIFHAGEVIKLRDKYLNGAKIPYQKVWNLLVFQLWYERWMKDSL